MVRMALSTQNKVERFNSFPRLRLKFGEKARIVCLEEPEVLYVHALREPQIENGKVKYKREKNKKTGEYEERYDLRFVSQMQCLGDFGTLQERGADIKNCPVCAESVKSDQFGAPQRKFAMHVARYAAKSSGSGFEVAEPFAVSIVAWVFNDRTFNQLVDIASEIENPKGLLAHDLNLGPCDNETFQNYGFQVAMKAEYMASPERQKYLADAFASNQADDLGKVVAKTVSADWMKDEIDQIRSRWRQVVRIESNKVETPENGNLDEALDQLDSEPEKQSVLTGSSSKGETLSFDDILGA